MCSHIPLKEWTQIRKVRLQKVETQKWKHSVHSHFRKYRKRSIPRTEEFGDLITVERKSESRNNHQVAALVQDLTIRSILPVWNQNFTGDGEEFYGSFQSRHRSQKFFLCTIYQNLASEELSRNHHFIAQKQEIAERAVRRVKEGTSAVLLQSGLNEKWWSDSMKCC